MSDSKRALITGATGQDGTYLAEFLLSRGYEVHGVKRRSSSFNTQRVDHIYQDRHEGPTRFSLHYGDLTDATNLIRIVQETQPDEIYNLGAQSHVAVSFETPEYTANADAVGALRLLEAIRILGLEKKTRFYQASTSELYGKVQDVPQDETTPFYPRSPYAAAKLYAYWITVNYREAYGMHASNGILFNHESPIRGETFVTRKITRAVAAIHLGRQDAFISATSTPSATGAMRATMSKACGGSYSRRPAMITFSPPAKPIRCANSSNSLLRKLASISTGLERASRKLAAAGKTGRVVVRIDPRYFRPTEVDLLIGDPAKAREKLGWSARIGLEQLCSEMVASDLVEAQGGRPRQSEIEAFLKEFVAT